MDKHWCMCTKLKMVARDGRSTCSICGGKDAYGLSKDRSKPTTPNQAIKAGNDQTRGYIKVIKKAGKEGRNPSAS